MRTKRALLLYLAFAFAVLGLVSSASALAEEKDNSVKLVIFYKTGCSNCKAEMEWLETLKLKYSNLVVEEYEESSNMALFQEMCAKYNASPALAPTTFIGDKIFVSFENGNGDLSYNPAYKAYIGYSTQIEKEIVSSGGLLKADVEATKLVLFYSETCPHCHDERAWLETIRPTYPQLVIEEYEVGANAELFRKTCAEYNASCSGVPMTFVAGKAFAGFVNGEGELVYDQARRAYIGYSSQMEKAVRECLNDTCSVMAGRVIDVSKNDSLVESLIAKYPDSIATMFLNETKHVYLVAWWSPERIASSLYYPDVLVYVDGVTGEILKSEIPTKDVPGLDKPGQGMSWIYVVMLSLIAIYLLAYLFLQKRLRWEGRYWTTGFISLIIIFFFVLAMMTPQEMIGKFAAKFPFPVFVFLVALADGFNPCAFAVLIVLLSLLTHTKSRKKMLLVGAIFILTSAVMYFLFIMAVTTFLASMLPGDLRSILFKLIGAGVVFVGLVNIKDFLFFKKGVSVGISEKHKGQIYKNAGKIVRRVDDAKNKTSLILALFATALLAAFVNLVEFGCTALLPMAYSSALFAKYGTTFGLYHYLYTFFYSLVYVIPLFAILANFLYYFKSERLSERQARILKLFGGIIMLVMGMALLLNTTLPAFG